MRRALVIVASGALASCVLIPDWSAFSAGDPIVIVVQPDGASDASEAEGGALGEGGASSDAGLDGAAVYDPAFCPRADAGSHSICADFESLPLPKPFDGSDVGAKASLAVVSSSRGDKSLRAAIESVATGSSSSADVHRVLTGDVSFCTWQFDILTEKRNAEPIGEEVLALQFHFGSPDTYWEVALGVAGADTPGTMDFYEYRKSDQDLADIDSLPLANDDQWYRVTGSVDLATKAVTYGVDGSSSTGSVKLAPVSAAEPLIAFGISYAQGPATSIGYQLDNFFVDCK